MQRPFEGFAGSSSARSYPAVINARSSAVTWPRRTESVFLKSRTPSGRPFGAVARSRATIRSVTATASVRGIERVSVASTVTPSPSVSRSTEVVK